jgi:hypothetical protein
LNKIIFLDSRCFPNSEKNWQDAIREELPQDEFAVRIAHIPEKGSVHETDLQTFGGIGFAVAGIAIGIARLLKQPAWSYDKLQKEVVGYLALKGVKNFEFKNTEGFENLIEKNGQPCVVTISCSDGKFIRLYVGVTKEIIIVSPTEFDFRYY